MANEQGKKKKKKKHINKYSIMHENGDEINIFLSKG